MGKQTDMFGGKERDVAEVNREHERAKKTSDYPPCGYCKTRQGWTKMRTGEHEYLCKYCYVMGR